jgi:hypothetical protein
MLGEMIMTHEYNTSHIRPMTEFAVEARTSITKTTGNRPEFQVINSTSKEGHAQNHLHDDSSNFSESLEAVECHITGNQLVTANDDCNDSATFQQR